MSERGGILGWFRDAPKVVVLNQAGEALAYYLVSQQITPAQLEEALRAGHPVLQDALAQAPENEMALARRIAGQFARAITPEDYPQILQALAGHPECAAHARLLYRPDVYWTYFVPAVEVAKQWLIHGPLATGSPEAVPPPD